MPVAPVDCARQLLVVRAPDWRSTAGQLQRYVRETGHENWQPVGASISVSLGRAGLAWGRGLHPPQGGPEKREGDGCAPAGVFAITSLFGTAPAESAFARAAQLPYMPTSPDLKAIDDPASAHYNRIVDQRTMCNSDWTSCEEMWRSDERYALGAVVAHNAEPSLAGAGSCIFLHVWAGPGVPTVGCTAMTLADMREIAAWLDAAALPLLVQLPWAEYERWRETWRLPEAVTPTGC